MLCNLFWGSGILGVTYLSFYLGLQFYSVIIAYGTHNYILYIILILAIHGTFELFAMAIICSASIDILSIWKNYLVYMIFWIFSLIIIILLINKKLKILNKN